MFAIIPVGEFSATVSRDLGGKMAAVIRSTRTPIGDAKAHLRGGWWFTSAQRESNFDRDYTNFIVCLPPLPVYGSITGHQVTSQSQRDSS